MARLCIALLTMTLSASGFLPVASAQEPERESETQVRTAFQRAGLVVDWPLRRPSARLQHVRFLMRTEHADRPGAAGGAIQTVQVETLGLSKSGPIRAPRGIRLSPERLVVAAVDAAQGLRGFAIVPDPRLQRLEYVSDAGDFQSHGVDYAPEARFGVALPDDPEIAAIHFYAARWNGTSYDFVQVATVSFPSNK